MSAPYRMSGAPAVERPVVVDDIAQYPEERITDVVIRQRMAGFIPDRRASVGPRTFLGMAKRLYAKVEYVEATPFEPPTAVMRLMTPVGHVDVYADPSVTEEDVAMGMDDRTMLLTTDYDYLTPEQLEQRFEIEEREAVQAMERAEATRTVMRGRGT